MLARTLSFLTLISISVATAVLVYDGALTPSNAEDGGLAGLFDVNFDVPSLILGGALGVIVGQVLSVPWLEIPRRVLGWFTRHQATFVRIAMAVLFLGILIYY
ncbi:MAG: hypothetical protein AAFV69_14775 [Pseudomonadota bacterium]